MTDGILLTSAFRNNLLAIKNAARQVDRTSERLATGLEVNSALDNPQNFFTARALNHRASDLSRLLDGVSQSAKVIEEGIRGVEGIEKLLNLAETEAQTTLEDMKLNGEPSGIVPSGVDPLSDQILAANPIAYWQLNETAGATAVNLGSLGAAVNGSYQNTPTLDAGGIYGDDDSSVDFNGTNESVSIPNHAQINAANHAQRSVEVTFNADVTTGRQVIYEEGGATNAFSIYIFNGSLYVTGRDQGAWGPANISAPVVAGQTYHAAFTFDFPGGVFRGYLNGVEIGNTAVNAIFPSHTAAIGIGRMNNDSWFHDGAQTGNGFYFNGKISDVAIYNSVLSAPEIADHYASVKGDTYYAGENQKFNSILDQIDLLVQDAHYRGINLLQSDSLKTFFNESNTHFIETKGVNFSSTGLGINRTDFNRIASVENILQSIRDARKTVRNFGRTLANDFSVITIRETFIRESIITIAAGALDLTQADENEEGANLLGSQTRLTLATTSLSLAAAANANILDVIS